MKGCVIPADSAQPTSPVLLGQVGKTPYIAQANSITYGGQDKGNLGVPSLRLSAILLIRWLRELRGCGRGPLDVGHIVCGGQQAVGVVVSRLVLLVSFLDVFGIIIATFEALVCRLAMAGWHLDLHLFGLLFGDLFASL